MTTLVFLPNRLAGKESALIEALGKADNLIVPVTYGDGTLNAGGSVTRIKEQCEQLARYSPGLKVSLILVGDAEPNPENAWQIKNTLAHYGIYLAGVACTRADIKLVCVLAANGHITWLNYASIGANQVVSEWQDLHPEVVL